MPKGIYPGNQIQFEELYEPEPTTGCWLWLRPLNNSGYGNYKNKCAHRWAYENFVGPIPRGLEIRHKCHVRCCVNPGHMTTGDRSDNMQDAARAFHINTTKLTPAAIAEIRALPRRPRSGRLIGVDRLAEKFGVDRHTIRCAANGLTWKTFNGQTN